ncbi:MAG: glycosyltransferase family 1 protein [Acidobacteriota bacterium]
MSEFTARQVETLLKVERGRIRVVPHGVDPALPSTVRENIVLSTGAIQKRKNIARLVRAFERTPRGWTLVLAGASDGFGAAEELRAMEASPRHRDIRVAGYVSDDELRHLYSRARIFAFPSLDEGFGMPVLDAMASGVPVITSNRSAMPEVAGDAALLVDPEDEGAIGDALVRLIDDEMLRNQLVDKGHARAAGLTWQRAVRSTWAVYQELR